MSDVINAESVSNKFLHEVMPVIKAMINLQFTGPNNAIPGLFGDAGIGKTANIRQMCIESNWNLLDVHYGLKPLEEISGLPDFGEVTNINGVDIKRTHWTLPDILGDAYELSKNGKPTVIFLDDFHTASPGNMALGYEMFTSKKLRGYPFPAKSAFVLAANVSGAKSLANPIPAPIMNRIARFNIGVSFESWKKNFAIANGINSKILAFLSNPKYTKYFQTTEVVNKPWSSARAWTNFSTILNCIEKYQPNLLDTVDPYYLASAYIDTEAALNFSKYYILFGDINTAAIFRGEIPINIPSDLQKKYVYLLACLDEFVNQFTKATDPNDQSKLSGILAAIIINIAETNSEIAVVGLKELILIQNTLKIKLYSPIMTAIEYQSPIAAKRIGSDVKALIS